MYSSLTLKRRFLGLAGGALFVALLAACGGGDDDSNDDPTPAATSSSSGSSNSGGSNSGSSATPSTGATSTPRTVTNAGIASLKSYKYSMKFSGNGGPVGDILSSFPGASSAEFSGAFITPDKSVTTIKGGGFEATSTIIGNQQWQSFAGLVQGPRPATASDIADANILAAFWDDSGFSESLKSFNCGGTENVNGVSTKKCSLDKAGFEKLVRENPDFAGGLQFSSLSKAEAQIWVTDADYPVRMRMDVAGKDKSDKDFSFKVEMDVTDINGNFQITAPKT